MSPGSPHPTASVREATPAEFVPVVRTLEGALLSLGGTAVRDRIASGDVLVVAGDGHVRGALVLDGGRVAALAVRSSWRGRGLGRALVEAASDRRPRLTAEFDPEVRGFYEALGFEIVEREDRLWGVRE